jgi:hypothetical protein
MLVRKFVAQALTLLKKHNWNPKLVQKYNQLILEHPLSLGNTGNLGIKLHYSDLFTEELHKLEGNEVSDLKWFHHLISCFSAHTI